MLNFMNKFLSLRSKIHTKLAAFTLIELLIVITITIILFGFGFFRIWDYQNRQSLDLTKQSIAMILRNAQDRSISQESGVRWGVHFENPSGSGNDFYELFSGVVYSTSSVISKNNLNQSIQFINPSAGASKDMIFAAITGLPSASSSVIISLVGDSSASSTIIVNANGRIEY